jgi:osmoprotectant transport system ATP-binding protein
MDAATPAPGFRLRSTRATSYGGVRTYEYCANVMASAPLIELITVTKSFDGERSHALRDASLRIDTGGFIALVGTSGSGKTTALKMINRLIEPDRGEVRFDGETVASLDAPTLRRRIGYVFQGIGLFPHMTIGENIAITPQLLGWTKGDIEARVAELLDLVELPRNYGGRFPHALSGGQRQRAGVARAIAARPRVMLMDEPFGALDPVTRDTLGTSYRALHERLGMTTVMVTHDVQEAVLLADRIVVMSAGRIVADDTPGALLSGDASAEVSALMAMPRRQAERISELLQAGGREIPRHPPHG